MPVIHSGEMPARDVVASLVPSATSAGLVEGSAERTTSARAVRLSRLIGARVPGGIDFSGATPAPKGPAIPLYRHPADANAVATRLAATPMLDLKA